MVFSLLTLIFYLRQFRVWFFGFLPVAPVGFPTVMDPEPVGRVAAQRNFERAVDIQHDGFSGTRDAVFVSGNFRTALDAPAGESDAVTDAGVQGAMITQREHGGCGSGGAIVAEERNPQAIIAAVLVCEEAEQQAWFAHRELQGGAIGASLKEKAAGALTQVLHQAIERGLAQATVGRGALKCGTELTKAGIKLEISEMADGNDQARRFFAGGRRKNLFLADEFDVRLELLVGHRSGFSGAGKILTDASEIFFGDSADFVSGFFLAEAHGQVAKRDTAVAGIKPIGEGTTATAEVGDGLERQSLDEGDDCAGDEIKELVHTSSETDFADAVLEVVGAADDFDFDAHEENREIASVDFREAHGILLSGDNHLGLAFLAAIDHVEDFLLREPVMVGEALGINEFGAAIDQIVLEAFRLRDSAQGRDLAA